MRSARVRALLPDELERLAELAPAETRARSALLRPDASWARAACEAWGCCGVVVVEERLRAAALVSPGLHLPAQHPLRRSPLVPQAAQLLGLLLDDSPAAPALVRQLGQGLARQLDRRAPSVEAVAARRRPGWQRPSAQLLDGAGFVEVEGPAGPDGVRMTLQLERSVRWQPDLQQAWHALAGLVPRPCPPPSATGREGGSTP